MFNCKTTTTRYVWDIYAELAAAFFVEKCDTPQTAAELTAKFADEMCAQRAVRFPPKDTKQ